MSQLNRNACTRCQIQFPSAIEHVAHMRRSNNHHLCQLCNNAKDFETFYEFREHVKSAHLGCIICAWNAPSPLGLTQHIMAVHNMCPECEGHFPTAHEQQGHCQVRRPRSVKCFGCEREFLTLSAVFNHLESSNCESGVTKESIEGVTRSYLQGQGVSHLCCPKCEKDFFRLCDLMQHAETASCRDGYWKGSGSVGQLVEYIRGCIPELIPPKVATPAGERTLERPADGPA